MLSSLYTMGNEETETEIDTETTGDYVSVETMAEAQVPIQ